MPKICFQKNTSPIFSPFRLQLKMIFAFLQGFASINISIVIYLPPLNTQNTVSKNPIMVQLIFGIRIKHLFLHNFGKFREMNTNSWICVFSRNFSRNEYLHFFFSISSTLWYNQGPTKCKQNDMRFFWQIKSFLKVPYNEATGTVTCHKFTAYFTTKW